MRKLEVRVGAKRGSRDGRQERGHQGQHTPVDQLKEVFCPNLNTGARTFEVRCTRMLQEIFD
jgi:hypothetical protein